MRTVNDTSYGIVPMMKKEGVWRVFLIQHRHALHWALPKGHPEKGETDMQAAERELEEEAGLKVLEWLPIDSISETYQFHHRGNRVNKTVTYFPALVNEEFWLDQEEIQDGGWFTLDAAIERASFPQAREIIKEVFKRVS
ncbi:MAG: NUDIX domain-containing protein [Simkaniaceae bacterium]|nr:NUDIX domain-containing protein [Simkaniaceae bacterium]